MIYDLELINDSLNYRKGLLYCCELVRLSVVLSSVVARLDVDVVAATIILLDVVERKSSFRIMSAPCRAFVVLWQNKRGSSTGC
jgi:hypothetical protein